jgi:hypothetical protein
MWEEFPNKIIIDCKDEGWLKKKYL